MNIAVDAIYEGGKLQLLAPLALPENTMVRISLENSDNEAARHEWLAQGERSLMATWDNEADDVYNALLST
jgi:predicted DNA-binding antitoxin AbrB/MazE fold protein